MNARRPRSKATRRAMGAAGLALVALLALAGTGAALGAPPPPARAPNEPPEAEAPEAPAAPSRGPVTSYSAALQRGWEAYSAGDLEASERAYRAALALQPRSEDAALGLSSVLMARGRWKELEAGMAALLAHNPLNGVARLRHGLALYRLGRPDEALAEYLLVLERDPDDGDAWLGVGWSQLARAETDAARDACTRAQARGRGEPAQACLDGVAAAERARAEGGRAWRAVAELYGAYLTYSDPWEREDLRSVQVFAGVEGPGGLRMGVDAAESHSTLQYEEDDERVRAVGVGVSADGGLGWIGAHLLSQWVDNASQGASLVGLAEAGLRAGAWGPGVAVAAQRNGLASVLQLEPGLRWSVTPRLSVALGARMIGVWEAPEPGQGQGQGQGPQRGSGQELTEQLWSGSARVRWVPHQRVALGLSGWAGERRYSVEGGGSVVSTTGDRFVRGARLDVGVDLTRWLSVWAAAQADWGDELLTTADGAQAHDFVLYGAVLGLAVRL